MDEAFDSCKGVVQGSFPGWCMAQGEDTDFEVTSPVMCRHTASRCQQRPVVSIPTSSTKRILELTCNRTAQFRAETNSESERKSLKNGIEAIEIRIQEHMTRTLDQSTEAALRINELEHEHNGSADFDGAIEEVKKRVEVLELDQVSCGVAFAQAKSCRSGIDIAKVLTTDKSIAFVGLPASVVGKVNLRVGEVTTQGGSTAHVGVFGD